MRNHIPSECNQPVVDLSLGFVTLFENSDYKFWNFRPMGFWIFRIGHFTNDKNIMAICFSTRSESSISKILAQWCDLQTFTKEMSWFCNWICLVKYPRFWLIFMWFYQLKMLENTPFYILSSTPFFWFCTNFARFRLQIPCKILI